MTDERVIAYLLGELTEEESDQFEEELFSADEWQTDMKGVEDELIDDYVRGNLSPERKRLFEANFLRSESRCQRVAIAMALVRKVGESDQPSIEEESARSPSWFDGLRAGWSQWGFPTQLGMVAALLVVVAGTMWFIAFRNVAPKTFADVTLNMASGTRDPGDPKTARISLGDREALRLTLALPDGAARSAKYQVQLRQVPDRLIPVYSSDRVGSNLTVVILAGNLRPGLYLIILSTTDAGGRSQPIAGDYRFIVE